MKKINNPLIVAIDKINQEEVERICQSLVGQVEIVKVGIGLYFAQRNQIIEWLKGMGFDIFLDLKLHDIPHQIGLACREMVRLGIKMFTLHISGGKEMMMEAVRVIQEEAKRQGVEKPLALGVTILTSLDQEDLKNFGIEKGMEAQVLEMAKMAQQSGLDGVICSPHEIELVRKNCGPEFMIVSPGIRTSDQEARDQKRFLSSGEAIRRGADYIVVGREITEAVNPGQVVQGILQQISI